MAKNVIDFLISGGKLTELTEKYAIRVLEHSELPLVILNYDQIDSRPKANPIIRECRGLVLEKDTWNVVALSFRRFFNWGEEVDEMNKFDFSDFRVDSKEDGSLLIIYHYDGKWRVNTRGSFAQSPIDNYTDYTWESLALEALGIDSLEQLDGVLDPKYSYIGELVSPYNQIVRIYHRPSVYLLTVFNKETLKELRPKEVDELVKPLSHYFLRPEKYDFVSIDEIIKFLNMKSNTDPSFEGVVIQDANGERWKIKNPTYLSLHKMRGNGDNIYKPSVLIPHILSNNRDELLTYFPMVADKYDEYAKKINEEWENLKRVWEDYYTIADQKDFAKSVIGKTIFTGILFRIRKIKGTEQNISDLREAWIDSGDMIEKFLFSK